MMGISDLGVDDDFFELGGDSIMMIQIQFTNFREYKIRLSTAVLTEKSSIRVFAGEIENHSAI